jgi:hypothetical protein
MASQVAHGGETKKNHQNMHPRLTNMDLQEGVVIRGIPYIHLHIPQHLDGDCVNIFDKYMH